MASEFDKYQRRGAYHWRELSRNPFRAWPYTRSRVEWVVRQCRTGKNILEIGCGDAATLGRLAREGKSVTGIDTDETALRLAREQFAKRGLAGEFFEDLRHVDGRKFDTVIMAELIEHVQEPKAILETVAGRLSPDGLLILTTPIRVLEYSTDAHHVHEFWPDELEGLLRSYFDDVRVEKMHPVWLIDLQCYMVKGFSPVAFAVNLVNLLSGIELLDKLPSPLSIFWTQGAVCRGAISPRTNQ